jgi:hypothetical protein
MLDRSVMAQKVQRERYSMTDETQTRVSLTEWLSRFTGEDTEATTYGLQVKCDLSLYRGQHDDGSFTGGIGIQVNFMDDTGEYVAHGFLETEVPGQDTPDTIAETLLQAFGIDAEAPIWEVEDME